MAMLRLTTWLGQMGLALVCGLALGAAMPVQAGTSSYAPPKPQQKTAFVHFDGMIVPGDAAALQAKLTEAAASGKVLAVMLASSGGDWNEAMAMGRVIRQAHADTYHQFCASACVMAYLGGERRLFGGADKISALLISRPEFVENPPNRADPALRQQVAAMRAYAVQHTGSALIFDLLLTVSIASPQTLTAAIALETKAATASLQ
jgi:hypothetical protein